MQVQKTTAILLRRVDYGDADLILTFFSEDLGKISLIAKHAKKSRKRFAGALELFTNLNIQYRRRRQGGLAVLEEAHILDPFAALRQHILKTAYASYWAELAMGWAEDDQPLAPLYHLLVYALGELDAGRQDDALLNLAFQMRFMSLAGLCPNLNYCCVCRTEVENFQIAATGFDLPRGGLCCRTCDPTHEPTLCLSRGTIKQLQWIAEGDLARIGRIRFSSAALNEAQTFMEAFVPYHLGKEPRSLKFLRQIRPRATAA
ncbi:MAG: DNA repair protein RecO [Desulfobacterales bacterium]|nr:DNA repair protein RecO [Desulfobacterales bacterium]